VYEDSLKYYRDLKNVTDTARDEGFEVARKALEKGKHVLVEKPMTTDVEHARELVELAESKGLILQVGHVERFNGAVLELRRVVDKPVLIESRRLAPNSGRIQDVGVVMDLLIHDLTSS
jgi:predicted dehydrogenase